ncbi:MAG: mycothiol synthase [Microthrixaceae bacterium]
MPGSSLPRPRWISPATEETDRLMAKDGLRRVRALFQMRRPLPIDDDLRATTRVIDVRPFRPDQDADGFLRVNNRAFSWHPDQGNWTSANLASRMTEPWFDTDGFLIHESAGEIDGFCWTKVHQASDEDPAMGEIFVIAADPSTHGTGLGRALTIAGLDHLAGLGLSVGMLYVEHDNQRAVSLYERLGFDVHHTDAEYDLVAGTPGE